MRIQTMSDLHLEFAPFSPPLTDVDVIVMAGDIGVGGEGVLFAQQTFSVPVIYVAGNHEYHDPDNSIVEHMATMKQMAADSNVVVLDNEVMEIGEVRFIGSTMWTDLQILGSVLHCDYDHIIVKHEAGRVPIHFSLEYAQGLFEENKSWLKQELAKPFGGKTVVVTHHAPSLKSLHPQYATNPWNPCFMTDMEDLMDGVDLWIHGHTHNCFDYLIGGTRVVCNPRGYPNPLGGWENPEFNPMKVVTL